MKFLSAVMMSSSKKYYLTYIRNSPLWPHEGGKMKSFFLSSVLPKCPLLLSELCDGHSNCPIPPSPQQPNPFLGLPLPTVFILDYTAG